MAIPENIKISDQVVCFPIRKVFGSYGEEKKILTLARKKRTWAVGKLAGYGGKVEWNEDLVPEKCKLLLADAGRGIDRSGMRILNALKEIEEESGIRPFPGNIIRAGEIWVIWPDKIVFLNIFTISFWKGSFIETDEMGQPERFDVRQPLPWSEMIEGDELWLPSVIEGRHFHAVMEKDHQGKVSSFEFVKPQRWWM